MNTIEIRAPVIHMAEVEPNGIYMTVSMRMFSTRPNVNGIAVTEAFIDHIVANAAKYVCIPLCADTTQLRHGRVDGLGHMQDKDTGAFMSEQIGSFYSFAKVQDEFGISLIGEARIPKRDAAICGIIMQMYATRTLNFSFEIMVSVMSEQDGVQIIDAAEGNELIGMAVVTIPAYPEATALSLVAEKEKGDDPSMDEAQKRIAELEAKLQQAEQKNVNDEELRKRDEELTEEKEMREKAETELADAKQVNAEKDTRIAELEAQVDELTPFRAEAEKLRQEKADAELAAKRQELSAFAESQGLDTQSEAVVAAIQEVNYAFLMAEAMKQNKKPQPKPTLASFAVAGGMPLGGEYDDLLGKG